MSWTRRGWVGMVCGWLLSVPAWGPVAGEEPWLHLRDGTNELLARRQAPVGFTHLSELIEEIERPGLDRPAALRLTRTAPPERIDYFFGVTREGLLLLGRRVERLDYGAGRYVFDRGQMVRSYPPLEGEPSWTWLVELPVSRETRVTLTIRAVGPWPCEAVTITPVSNP